MKKISFFLMTLTIMSCTKTSTTTTQQGTVEYQVTAINPNIQLFIGYNNDAGLEYAGWYLSGWKYSLIPKQKPFTASLQVTLNGNKADSTTVTLRILVNGNIVQQKIGIVDVNANNDSGTIQHIQYVVN